MSDVDRREAQRFDYLVALYELSNGGDPLQWATHRQIAERAGISEDEIMTIGQIITGQYLAEFKTMGGLDGHVSITANGVQRAEEIIRERERAGLPRFSGFVVLTDEELLMKLEQVVGAIRKVLDTDPTIDLDILPDLESDLQSATDQLRAARPNRGVIKASLGRINGFVPTIAALTGTGAAIIDILHGLGL